MRCRGAVHHSAPLFPTQSLELIERSEHKENRNDSLFVLYYVRCRICPLLRVLRACLRGRRRHARKPAARRRMVAFGRNRALTVGAVLQCRRCRSRRARAGLRAASRRHPGKGGPGMAVGAGQPLHPPVRPHLHSRIARAASKQPPTCRGLASGRCAVGHGGRRKMPRAVLRYRRDRGQSYRARFHRHAASGAGFGAQRSAAVPHPPRCRTGIVGRADALAGFCRAERTGCMGPACAGQSDRKRAAVPGTRFPPRRVHAGAWSKRR